MAEIENKPNTPAPVADALKAATAEIDALKAALAESGAKVEALESALEEAPTKGNSATIAPQKKKAPSECPEFTLEGKKYRFLIPGFSTDGATVIYAVDAVKDQKLLKTIVTEFPGTIERV